MLRKTITYTNAFGVEKTKEAFFALTQEELIKIKTKFSGIVDNFDESDTSAENIQNALNVVKELLYTSYFETDEDGDYINKSPEVKEKFINSIAGQTLFDQLVSDPKVTEEFMLGAVSHTRRNEVAEAIRNGLIS